MNFSTIGLTPAALAGHLLKQQGSGAGEEWIPALTDDGQGLALYRNAASFHVRMDGSTLVTETRDGEEAPVTVAVPVTLGRAAVLAAVSVRFAAFDAASLGAASQDTPADTARFSPQLSRSLLRLAAVAKSPGLHEEPGVCKLLMSMPRTRVSCVKIYPDETVRYTLGLQQPRLPFIQQLLMQEAANDK